jgi:nucleotide-binding universal stress UspA family protein
VDRILIADDGSESAMKAVEIACDLAVKTGAELIALAVIDPREIRPTDIKELAGSENLGLDEAREYLAAASADYLGRCEEAATRAGVRRFRSARCDGDDPAFEIVDFARASNVDLIVVGCRGRGRLPGLLLGSVSQKLASHAPCSVLIAR